MSSLPNHGNPPNHKNHSSDNCAAGARVHLLIHLIFIKLAERYNNRLKAFVLFLTKRLYHAYLFHSSSMRLTALGTGLFS